MTWIASTKETLFRSSVEKKIFDKAKAEWLYTGWPQIDDDQSTDCELCGHPRLKYLFPIVNDKNHGQMIVGSECIKKFGIRAVDSDGRILSDEETGNLVQADRRRLVLSEKLRRVINSMVELSTKDPENNERFDSMLDYYRIHEAFTPKQINLAFWRLTKENVPIQMSDFKMTLKGGKTADFLALAAWQVRKFKGCLTSYQRNLYEKKNGPIG